jgi:hypothetical protein
MTEGFSFDVIARNFIRRGVNINPPASWEDLAALDLCIGFKTDISIKRLYLVFNGFQDMDFDPGSEICFWPISEILRSRKNVNDNQVVFADFSLCSHLYMCDFRKGTSPVIDRELGAEVSPSFIDFARSVSEGTFDF